MKTITIKMSFTDSQLLALDNYLAQQKTVIPGDQPGDDIHRQTYPSRAAFLADMFASSIRHILPPVNDGEAARLQREAEEAHRKAKAAQLATVEVTEGE